MYREVKSCVMVNGEQTEWFETCLGVRQGCVLSPILYSIFINGFAKAMTESGVGGVSIGEESLQLLLFADGIVRIARRSCRGCWRCWRGIVGSGGWRWEYKYVGVMASEDGGWKKAAQRVVGEGEMRVRVRACACVSTAA